MGIQRKYRLYNGQKVYDYHLNDELNQLINAHNNLSKSLYNHLQIKLESYSLMQSISANKLKYLIIPQANLSTPYLTDMIVYRQNKILYSERKFNGWYEFASVVKTQNQFVAELGTALATKLYFYSGDPLVKMQYRKANPDLKEHIVLIRIKNNGPKFKVSEYEIDSGETKTIKFKSNADPITITFEALNTADALDFYAFAPEIIEEENYFDYEEIGFQYLDEEIDGYSAYVNFPYPIIFYSTPGTFLDMNKWTIFSGTVTTNGYEAVVGSTSNIISHLGSKTNFQVPLGSKLVVEWYGEFPTTAFHYNYMGLNYFDFKHKWENQTITFLNVNGVETALEGLYTLRGVFKVEVTANNAQFFVNNTSLAQVSHTYSGPVRFDLLTYDANKYAYLAWIRAYYVP